MAQLEDESRKPFLWIENSLPILKGKKLLVVDYYADCRLLYKYLFEDYGAEVITVESAQEAFAAIRQSMPHLLVSEISLPGEDGYSLIRRVRNLSVDQGGQIPAIAITGLFRDIDQLKNAPTEFQHYFIKPVDLNKLLEAVVTLLMKYSAYPPSAPTMHG